MITKASTLSLPTLTQKLSNLRDRKDFEKMTELPVEIELGKEFKFHNIFKCPVAKEISQKDNPPCLLTCGHVISKLSMN